MSDLERFGRRPKEKMMGELAIVLAVVGIWLLLQLYILPKLGFST